MKRRLEEHAEKMRLGTKKFDVPPRVLRIIAQAAIDWGVAISHVQNTSFHDPRVVMARRQAVKEIHELGFSSAMVGRFLGGMHHTSVLYALKQTARPKRLPKIFPKPASSPEEFESGEWAI